MRKVKTALIGCGKVSDLHAGALTKTLESQFVAVYSRNQDKVKRYGEKYDVQGFSDIQEMIVSAGVDAVIICTPHPAQWANAVFMPLFSASARQLMQGKLENLLWVRY